MMTLQSVTGATLGSVQPVGNLNFQISFINTSLCATTSLSLSRILLSSFPCPVVASPVVACPVRTRASYDIIIGPAGTCPQGTAQETRTILAITLLSVIPPPARGRDIPSFDHARGRDHPFIRSRCLVLRGRMQLCCKC